MIIITAPVHPYLIASLEAKGHSILYEPSISYDSLSEMIAKATGLVVTTRLKLDKALLEKASVLKWIGRLGSGLELIDVEFAGQKGIACISTPEGNCTAVGEHTLGLLLSLLHKIHFSANQVKEGLWKRNENRGTELTGKAVGIIGFGNTGGAFAKVLSGFGVRILVYDKYKTGFAKDNIFESSLEEILAEANVISFHIPLTPETAHMANAGFFERLVQKPILLNTSRGKVVDTSALVNALKCSSVAGAGLDVLENEKIDKLSSQEILLFEELNAMGNVIITPHIAGYSHEAYLRMSEKLLEKLAAHNLI